MPQTRTEAVPAFAHCRDPRCAGYSQQPVDGLRDTVDHTYVDSGGDSPGIEKSMVYVRFADEGDSPCPTCGEDREVTEQKRKVYQPLSGHDPAGLLQYKPPEVGSPPPVSDKQAAMAARISELEAELEIGKV